MIMKSPRLRVPLKGPQINNALTKYSLLGSAAALQEMATEQKPLLDRLCLSGEATVWYGKYGTGKTLLCLHLVIEAIQDGRIAGHNVYYLNSDDSSSGLATKVKLMEDHGVHVLAQGHRGFRCSILTGIMQQMADDRSAAGVFVIVDTLKKFVDVMDKKANRAFNEVVRGFVMAGGTFLALAHTNKRLDNDGKPIPEGTSDVLNDFDCAYLLDVFGTDQVTGHQIVEFAIKKSRGSASARAYFTYDARGDVPYVERLCTVRPFDPDTQKYELRLSDDVDEAKIVEAIELCLTHGTVTKMDVARTAAKSLQTVSRRAVLKVLETYTGSEPGVHLWNYEIQERGRMAYALLAAGAASPG